MHFQTNLALVTAFEEEKEEDEDTGEDAEAEDVGQDDGHLAVDAQQLRQPVQDAHHRRLLGLVHRLASVFGEPHDSRRVDVRTVVFRFPNRSKSHQQATTTTRTTTAIRYTDHRGCFPMRAPDWLPVGR